LGLQWSGNKAGKKKTRKRRVGIKRRGLRMAPEKVRRRVLHHPLPVSIVVLLIFFVI